MTIKKTRNIFLASLLVLGLPVGAAAQGAPSDARWDTLFNRFDTNRDGSISREEADKDPFMKDEYRKMDSANRGMVSREEWNKYTRSLNPNSSYPKGHPFGDPLPK